LDIEGFPLLLSKNLCNSCGLCAEVCIPSAIAFTKETRAGLDNILAQQYSISEPAA
jgi:ferredoxin